MKPRREHVVSELVSRSKIEPSSTAAAYTQHPSHHRAHPLAGEETNPAKDLVWLCRATAPRFVPRSCGGASRVHTPFRFTSHLFASTSYPFGFTSGYWLQPAHQQSPSQTCKSLVSRPPIPLLPRIPLCAWLSSLLGFKRDGGEFETVLPWLL